MSAKPGQTYGPHRHPPSARGQDPRGSRVSERCVPRRRDGNCRNIDGSLKLPPPAEWSERFIDWTGQERSRQRSIPVIEELPSHPTAPILRLAAARDRPRSGRARVLGTLKPRKRGRDQGALPLPHLVSIDEDTTGKRLRRFSAGRMIRGVRTGPQPRDWLQNRGAARDRVAADFARGRYPPKLLHYSNRKPPPACV